jgi:hypothetical protein
METRRQRGVSKMTTKAYFLIRVWEDLKQDGYLDWIKDLESMPEVQYITPVTGLYDVVARVEAPVTAMFVAHKVMADSHVKHLHVLRVEEPEKKEERLGLEKQREIIRLRRREMQGFGSPPPTG